MKFQSLHKKISNFIHDRQGFTLAELLIVVAILGILAAFGAVSVYRYQKNLHLTEMDDTAREIFAAAQNNLTNASADGGWENFYVTTDDNGNPLQENDLTVKYGEKINTKPSDYPDDMKWTDGSHDYRYIFINSDHADAYKDLMNQLLPSGSIDDTILPSSGNHHAIVIEYDAKTAIIYGVWYTDGKTGTFSSAQDITAQKMDEVRANGNGRPNLDPDSKISKDAKLYRRDKVKPQVGYYGGGASLGGDGKNVDSLQPMATVVNADELYVRVKLPSDSDKINTSITVYGDTSKKKQTLSFFKVKRSAKNNKQVKWSWYETEDHKRLSEKTSSAVYACYLLDSVTGNTENHFASQFGSNDNAFIPGENLTITVKNAVGARTREKVLHTNSLFDSIRNAGSGSSNSGNNTDEAKKYTAVIRYGRQLQNLSTAVSNVNAKNTDKLTVTGVRLAENIDWSKFYYSYGDTPKQNLKSETRGQSVQTSDSARLKNTTDEINLYKQSDNISQGKTGSTAFYSIVNDSLTSIDGRNHTISNLEIQKDRTDDTQGIGLIAGTKSNLTIKKLKIQDPSFTTKDNLGKAEYAGVFVGESSDSKLTIQNAQLIVSDGHSLAVTGENDAGLIAGRVTGRNNDQGLDYKNIKVKLNGTNASSVTAGNDDKEGTKNNPFGNAGGFVGYAERTVNISSSRIESNGNLSVQGVSKNENNYGGNAGGLIGLAIDSRIAADRIDIHLLDAVRDQRGITINGKTNAGGLIGFLNTASSDKNSIKSVQYDGGANGVVRSGSRAAGGLIARLESNGLTVSDSGVSSYIYLSGGKENAGRAGGFIGVIKLTSDNNDTNIIKSYYGGRTNGQGKYDTSHNGFDGKEIHQGGFNIVNENAADESTSSTAGGFIGTVQRQKNITRSFVNISASYTTGSVFVSANGEAGGFAGKASANDLDANSLPLKLTNTYATGVVGCDNKDNNKIGTFSGHYGINSDSRKNYYLADINDSSMNAIGSAGDKNSDYQQKKDVYTDKNQTTLIVGKQSAGKIPFTSGSTEASTYDSSLKDQKYPFQFVTDLAGNESASTLKKHIGDWPVVIPSGEKISMKVDNGNKLTIHAALPEGTTKFTLAVTGLTSGKTLYAPFIVDTDAQGKQSLRWINFHQASYHWWGNAGASFTSSRLARIETKQDYLSAPVSVPVGEGLLTEVDSPTDANDNSLFLAFDLDDISQDVQYEAGPFSELFRDLDNNSPIPGENITVRIATGWKDNVGVGNNQGGTEEQFDLTTTPGVTANSLFANGSDGIGTHTALIANARHLENLNATLSRCNVFPQTLKFTKASQTSDIIWSSNEKAAVLPYIQDICKKNGFSTVAIHGYNQAGTEFTNNNIFYPVNNTDITEYNGNGYSISKVNIDKAHIKTIKGDEAAALFTALSDKVSIHDLTIDSIQVNAEDDWDKSAAGLISKASNATISNVKITGDSQISANRASAAGMVGTSNGTLTVTNCLVAGKNLTISAGITTRDNAFYAGGIVGRFGNTYGDGAKLIISNTVSSAYVSAGNKGSAGGLVGYARISDASVISDSYTGGHTANGKYLDSADTNLSGHYNILTTNGNSGGLLGETTAGNLTIQACYSTASVYGNYAGGLVGISSDNKNITLNNCYYAGLVGGPENSKIGTVVGFANDDQIHAQATFYLYGINTPNVMAGNHNETVQGRGVVTSACDYKDKGIQVTDGKDITPSSEHASQNAITFDTTLNNIYPYKLVTELDVSGQANNTMVSIHYGDWPSGYDTNIPIPEEDIPTTITLRNNGGSYRSFLGNVYYFAPGWLWNGQIYHLYGVYDDYYLFNRPSVVHVDAAHIYTDKSFQNNGSIAIPAGAILYHDGNFYMSRWDYANISLNDFLEDENNYLILNQ